MTKGVPLALSHNLKLNRVLHEKVLLVAIEITETPRVPDGERAVIQKISDDISTRRTALRLQWKILMFPTV